MSNKETLIEFTADKGRVGAGRPMRAPEGTCIEALNVDFFQSALGRKRPGLTTVSLTSGPTTAIKKLVRHVPASDETASELWAIEIGGTPGTANVKRKPSTGWATPATEAGSDDDITDYSNATARSFNGKLFITGNGSTVKVWDGTQLRQVGISKPAAPTVANTGAGAYAATIRYYKVAFTEQVTGVTMRRGELSASVSFTPSGAGTAARVTKPTTPYGAPTHWELYGSPDDLNYYLLATTVVGTTTYDDSAAPSAYAGTQPPMAGDNTVPACWKCVARDGNRLLGWGSKITTEKQSRLWFTAVLGESYISDDERVPLDHYKDIGEADGDSATAISDNVNGAIYAFKRRHTYKLVPTGDVGNPYEWYTVSNSVGALGPNSILEAEDRSGNPCLYFVSEADIFRIGAAGLEPIGMNVRDQFSNAIIPVCYFADRRQVFFLKPGSCILVFHVDTGAWTKFTGYVGEYTDAACLYSPDPATQASLVPFFAAHKTTSYYLGYYDTTTTEEFGNAYAAYVLLPPRAPFGALHKLETTDPMLLAEGGSATVRVSISGDFATLSAYADLALTPTPTYGHVIKRAEEVSLGNVQVFQFQIGDPAGTEKVAWALDSISVNVRQKEGL